MGRQRKNAMGDEKMRAVEILMIEDSPTDVLMAKEALDHAKVLNSLRVVEDGVEAMQYLRREEKYQDVRRPDLVLLDLNMPRKNGLEVLAELKADEALRLIPVIVLTTSKAEEDVAKSYGLHANCYINKPVDFNAFTQVVRDIESFWFAVVTLPRE